MIKYLYSRKILSILPILLTILLLFFVLAHRYKLGLVRYFDIDEFMYPNWAYHMLQGKLPYKDFLMLVTPIYPLLLAPLTALFNGTELMVKARVLSFAITFLAACSIFLLIWNIRRSYLAVFAALLFLVLPMPSDKILEVRPDTLAMSVYIIGLIFLVKLFRRPTGLSAFLSGLFFSLSFLTLQKTLPYIYLAVLYYPGYRLAGVIIKKRMIRTHFWELFAGLALPLLIFFLWGAVIGKLPLIVYSVLKLPLEMAAAVGWYNPQPTFFYFQPKPIYYGQWEIGWGIITTYSVYILGLLAALAGIPVAYLYKIKDKAVIVLLFLEYLFAVAIYLLSPLRYPQYLIPSAFFATLILSLILHSLMQLSGRRKYLAPVWVIAYAGVLGLLYLTFREVNTPKFTYRNGPNFEVMERFWEHVPKDEYVLDLDGRTLYYPYPYYACCLPFGQGRRNMTMRLPSLTQALKETGTKYIYQDQFDRIGTLPKEDADFIFQNYEPMENGIWWRVKDGVFGE